MKQKPKLTLLRGKDTLDVDKLARAFFKLTGRKPTPVELEAAREKLKTKRT